MSTDNFEKIKGRPIQKEEWQLKELEKEKDENNRLLQVLKQTEKIDLNGDLINLIAESEISLTPATFNKNEKDKRNVVDISIRAIFTNMIIVYNLKKFYNHSCYKKEFEICKQYWSKMYKTIKETINDYPEIIIHESLGIFIKILHNIQVRCQVISNNLGESNPSVTGFTAFIDKLDYFINCLANDNYEGVEVFKFKDYKELIQSFKSGYMDLSKSGNSTNDQLLVGHFRESKRYIFLVHFISMNKDQLKMSSSIPLNLQSPSTSMGIGTVGLLENNKIFIVNGNQIDFGIDDCEIKLKYIEHILPITSNTIDNP
ncbi:hypothetical protein ACTFIY_011846 [Dictyostelium cf. discoideum]